MKKFISILFLAIILFSIIPINKSHAATVTTNMPTLKNITIEHVGGGPLIANENQFYFRNTTSAPSFSIKYYNDGTLVHTSTQANFSYYSYAPSTYQKLYSETGMSGVNYDKMVIESSINIMSFTHISKDGITNHSMNYNTDFNYTTGLGTSFNIVYDDTQFTIQTGPTLDEQLLAIAQNGLPEYIVYKNTQGTFAEYFSEFPLVVVNSDSVSGDNKAAISWTGYGDRNVYILKNNVFEFERIDIDSNFSTYSPSGEMEILRTSQAINFDSKTYNSSINGYDPEQNIIQPDDPLTLSVVSPVADFKTNKDKAYVEFKIDFPTIHPDDDLTLFHRSHYIPTRPQVKINGEWLLKGFGFESLTKIQSSNFNIIDEKYVIRGDRTIYTYKVLCTLSNTANPLNIWSDVKYVDFVLSRPLATSDIKYTYTDDVTISILKVASVDANADGIDDNTGEDMTNTPTPSNVISNPNPTNTYEDSDTENDTTDNYSGDLLDNFQNIISILQNFTSNMGGLMGFLPGEFTAVIVLSMSIGIFIFIFQTYRGAK